MARYYLEMVNGRIAEVVAQDETGVWSGAMYDLQERPTLKIGHDAEPEETYIKLPEWEEPRRVSTTSVEYLDNLRRVERSSYMQSRPTAIKERPGSAQEVIRAIFAEAGDDRIYVKPVGWLGQRLRPRMISPGMPFGKATYLSP